MYICKNYHCLRNSCHSLSFLEDINQLLFVHIKRCKFFSQIKSLSTKVKFEHCEDLRYILRNQYRYLHILDTFKNQMNISTHSTTNIAHLPTRNQSSIHEEIFKFFQLANMTLVGNTTLGTTIACTWFAKTWFFSRIRVQFFFFIFFLPVLCFYVCQLLQCFESTVKPTQ